MRSNSEIAPVEEKCRDCGEVRVCFGRYEEGGTIHIYCCKEKKMKAFSRYDCECDEYSSICGNERRRKNKLILKNKYCFSIEEARRIAAEVANKGNKVCGNCVSMLYHNDI